MSVVRRKLNVMELREKVVFFIFNKRSKYVLVQWESKLQNVFFLGQLCLSRESRSHTNWKVSSLIPSCFSGACVLRPDTKPLPNMHPLMCVHVSVFVCVSMTGKALYSPVKSVACLCLSGCMWLAA